MTGTEWIVLFWDGPSDRRWQRLCRRGFRHVNALTYCIEMRHWLCVEWSWSGLLVSPIDATSAGVMLEACHAALRARARFDGQPFNLPPMTCVAAIRHLLGIRRVALTPFALYRVLRSEGASPPQRSPR